MRKSWHIGFLIFFSLCLVYGGWLYLSHFGKLFHEDRLKRTSLLIPANVSTAYENALTTVLSEENHITLSGLSKLKRGLLDVSFTHKLEIGKDGWLFLQEEIRGRQVILQSLGAFRYTPYRLKLWQLIFLQRSAWAEANDMHYMLVFVPNKATIYPEYLPSRYHSVGEGTRQQLKTVLKDLFVVDLTDSIRQHKSTGILFLKNDTHWNEMAGFLAYQSLMRAMPEAYRTEPLSLDDCQMSIDTNRGGDLARLLLDELDRWEMAPHLVPLESHSEFIETRSGSIGPGLTPKVYVNPQASLPKVLFDHDSFFKDLRPFFSQHYTESVFLWGWQGFNVGLIQREKPSLVVDEFVERSLIGDKPRNEWGIIQNYWSTHFEELPLLASVENLSFEDIIGVINHLRIPKGKLPIVRMTSTIEQTDKLIIDYDDERGYYLLRDTGDVYYLEYEPDRIKKLFVEQGSACQVQVEVRLY
ncbi:MAG: hypothetical protein DHS20C18_12060 [Saprospiraceae bacterium]|nr:MAG: hypothetical protein DHS20C18_12060 [Saprospiraceae bacterium]